MTTTYLSGYDLDYRPETYWPDDPTIKTLSTVKGEGRRRVIRFRVAHGDRSVLADPMSDSSLPDAEREAAGALHPFFMGGEYLPDLLPREVEIARISLESTTYDVISVRARLARTRIHYRIVDEYETDYDVSPKTSLRPLSLRQIIHLLQMGGCNSFPEQLRDSHVEAGCDPEPVVNFATVSSEFYPELGAYYAREASLWLDACWNEAEQSEWTPAQEAEFQRRLLAGPWESPWAFANQTVDDLNPVDARMLGLWLQARTGDPEAAVIIDCPARKGEDICAIEIRWHDPEPGRLRIPAGEGVSVAAAFSRFLEADSPRNQRPRGSPSGIYPNYNVRVYNPDAEHRQWCEDRGIPLALFINYDGGGYNFHIFEFQTLEHATEFMAAFEIQGERRLWAEPALQEQVCVRIPTLRATARSSRRSSPEGEQGPDSSVLRGGRPGKLWGRW